MKIELEVADVKTVVDAINNATIAYGDIVSCIILDCEVPLKFQPLSNVSDEELTKRFNCLKDIYEQLLSIEKEV